MKNILGTRRLLITGSRDWEGAEAVEQALVWAWNQLGDAPILVSGGCRTGADRIAETLWRGWGLPVEIHEADWAQFGRKAGPIRNQQMVDLGADMCLAFIRNGSRGATGTANLANNAGIPTWVWRN